MKKAILCFLSLIAIALISFTACNGNNGGAGGVQGNEHQTNDEKMSLKQIVYADESIDVAYIRSVLTDLIGVLPSVDSEGAPVAGELALGDTARAITQKAKNALADELRTSDGFGTGYIIYCDGTDMAVYWMDPYMADIALEAFVSKCVDELKLVINEGTVMSKLYSTEEYENEKYWLALEATAGPELTEQLRKLNSFYEPRKLAEWAANLYDPDVGGFYYSASARDNEPFLPDVESTSFALSLMTSNGAIEDRNASIPAQIRKKILDFVKGLQSPEDGYFYHPQWPQGRENLNVDRYGRDIASAVGLITSLKYDDDGDGINDTQYPLYCAPGTGKCKEHFNKENESCVFPKVSVSSVASRIAAKSAVTEPLSSGVTTAVSRVSNSTVKAVSSSHPDYSSREAFSAWLERYNSTVKQDSGCAHNIAELRYEIIKYGYMDIVLDHLDRIQEEVYNEQVAAGVEPSGVWQYDADYRAVWGLLKYMALYNLEGVGRKIDIKYVPYIVKTCIKVIKMEPDPTSYKMNDLMNQWSGVVRIITNVKEHYGDEYVKPIYDLMRADAEELVENTIRKIEPFKCSDGSIAYQASGKSLSTIYGTYISLGEVEGDFNAAICCVNLYRTTFQCLGYDPVPLFSPSDGERFVEIISSVGSVEKNKQVITTIDFEGESMPREVSLDAKTPQALAQICNDPVDSSNNVLYFVSGTATNTADFLRVSATARGTNCYIFETDMYIDSRTTGSDLFQIKLGGAYMMTVRASGKKILIYETPSSSHTNGENLLCETEFDKWFRLRVEYYVNAESQSELEKPQIKVWLDETLVSVSSTYFGSYENATPSQNYGRVSFYSMRFAETYAYFDNFFFNAEDKEFNAESEEITDSRNS